MPLFPVRCLDLFAIGLLRYILGLYDDLVQLLGLLNRVFDGGYDGSLETLLLLILVGRYFSGSFVGSD